MALTVVRVLLCLQPNITNPFSNKSEGPVAWTRREGDGLHASCARARRLSRRVARPHRCQGDRQGDRQDVKVIVRVNWVARKHGEGRSDDCG